LINANPAGVNLNSAARDASLFAADKNQHLVKCVPEFSLFLDNKVFAQELQVIPFLPKPASLIEPFQQRCNGSRPYNWPDQIAKDENAIIGEDSFDFAKNALERIVRDMVPHTQTKNRIERFVRKIETFARHLLESARSLSSTIGDVTRVRVNAEIIIARERKTTGAAAYFEDPFRSNCFDFLLEK